MIPSGLETTGYLLIFAGALILIASIFMHRSRDFDSKKATEGKAINFGPIPISKWLSKNSDGFRVVQLGAFLLIIIYALWLFYFS